MKTEQQNALVVTGGTSGIGLAIANGFASKGWHVTAIGLEPATSPVDNIEFVELDVTNDGCVNDFFASLKSLHGLVNAAGIIRRTEEFQVDVFQQVLDINLVGAMRTSTAAKSLLSSSGGAIVNVASMLSFFGGGLVPAYAASKGGIAQLTKSLAIAWAIDGIRVNAVAPGWIETPMTAQLRDDPSRNQHIVDRTPMRRWGKPEEILGPVAFLLSDAASFVTGAVLPVDGGYLCC